MARGQKTDDATRAAVMAALLAGQGVMEVAREYHLSHSTVATIKKGIDRRKLDGVRREKEASFDELFAKMLAANLRALINIAETASDPEYTHSQEASQLATLHGVISDKTIRVFEAVGDPVEPTE